MKTKNNSQPIYKQMAREMVNGKLCYQYTVSEDDTSLTFYHAGEIAVSEPTWDYAKSVMGKEGAELKDFGLGFYTCTEEEYPLKLASAQRTMALSKYTVTLKGLRVLEFNLDLEWLLSIGFHRRDFASRKWCHVLRDRCREWLSGCDVAIGIISDDKTHDAIEGFLDNSIFADAAIAMVDAANYGKQYVFKTQEACDRLKSGFQGSVDYTDAQKAQYTDMFLSEKTEYNSRTDALRMEHMRRGGGEFFEDIITGGSLDGRVRF